MNSNETPGTVEAKKTSRSEEIQMRRQKIESLQREVEELELDGRKSEIEKNKARIQEITNAEKSGTLSSLYNYSSDFGNKANEEVVSLENKIRELEGPKKQAAESSDKKEKPAPQPKSKKETISPAESGVNEKDRKGIFENEAEVEKLEKEIQKAESFEALIKIIQNIEAAQGSPKWVSKNSLLGRIYLVQAGEMSLDAIPEKAGLREKVKELMENTVGGEEKKENKNTDLENEKKIKDSKNFGELFYALNDAGNIKGSEKSYSGEELISIINKVRSGELDIDYVTRTHGLREKVFLLMDQEKKDNKKIQTKEEIIKEGGAKEKEEVMSIEMKNAIETLDAVRMRYMLENKKYMEGRKIQGLIGGLWQKLRGIKPEPEPELPQELIASKENLKLAKIELGKQMMKEEKERLEGFGLSPEEVKKNLEVFKTRDVFEKLVLDEQIILEKFKQESWPPKEHGVFVKALQWYGKQNKITKLAVGTMVAAGGAAIGGMSAPATALFAGSYLVRGALATGVGLLAGKGFEKLVKDKSDENFEKSSGDIRSNFGVGELDVEKAAAAYRSASETKDKEKNKYNLAKNLVIAATAAWTNIGLSSLESYLSKPIYAGVDDSTIPKEQSTPTPKVEEIDAATIPPAPPVSMDFTHVVGSHDNMWTILRADMTKHVSGFSSLSRAAQNNAVDTLWQKFVHADPSQLKAMGILSGDPHILATGAKINIGGLVDQGMMDKAFSHASSLSSAKLVALHNDIGYMKGFKGIMREPYVNTYLNSRR